MVSWIPDHRNKRFEIEIESGVSAAEMAAAKTAGTVEKFRLNCPNPSCKAHTPISVIRGEAEAHLVFTRAFASLG